MNSSVRAVLLTSFASVILAIGAAGQITNTLYFEVSFPFYAGNAKLPAGAYQIRQLNPEDQMLVLESADGAHSVFLEYTTTSSETPHAQTDVTFNKYGDRDFINLLWVRGQNSGIQLVPTKSEQLAAKNTTPVRHSVAAH